MVLVLPGQLVVEGVQHGLPDDLEVGHGQEQEGVGLLVGDLGLERVQHELHGVLEPGQHGGDLDLDEELGGEDGDHLL